MATGTIKEGLYNRVNAHTFGDTVNITSYNSSTNKYTFPSDGYIRIRSGNTVNDACEVYVNDFLEMMAKCQVTNYTESNSMFVKKGMTCYTIQNTGSRGQVTFKPLI